MIFTFHDCEVVTYIICHETEVVMDWRARLFVACAIISALLTTSATAGIKTPRITMVGNGGACSLSSHKTFRMKLTGWQPGSTVQIKIYYADGSDYPFALTKSGRVKPNKDGLYLGRTWPCWPNKAYNVPDKKERYSVVAFQLGSVPLVVAGSTFRVVK
jgi:hypothetical protein